MAGRMGSRVPAAVRWTVSLDVLPPQPVPSNDAAELRQQQRVRFGLDAVGDHARPPLFRQLMSDRHGSIVVGIVGIEQTRARRSNPRALYASSAREDLVLCARARELAATTPPPDRHRHKLGTGGPRVLVWQSGRTLPRYFVSPAISPRGWRRRTLPLRFRARTPEGRSPPSICDSFERKVGDAREVSLVARDEQRAGSARGHTDCDIGGSLARGAQSAKDVCGAQRQLLREGHDTVVFREERAGNCDLLGRAWTS